MYKFPKHSLQYKLDDEYMTPFYAFNGLFEYIKIDKNTKIWEPFLGDGGSVKKMKKIGFSEVHAEDINFFECTAPDRDAILVTNPPFSIKKQVLRRDGGGDIFIVVSHKLNTVFGCDMLQYNPQLGKPMFYLC